MGFNGQYKKIIEMGRKNFRIENVGKPAKRKFYAIAFSEYENDYTLFFMDLLHVYLRVKEANNNLSLPKEDWNLLKQNAKEINNEDRI